MAISKLVDAGPRHVPCQAAISFNMTVRVRYGRCVFMIHSGGKLTTTDDWHVISSPFPKFLVRILFCVFRRQNLKINNKIKIVRKFVKTTVVKKLLTIVRHMTCNR